MKSLLAAVALSGLAACAWQAPRTDVGQSLSYSTGTGVVESVSRAPSPFTAAAGGRASASEELNRLRIRMDDGRIQYIDTGDTGFTRGTRVRLTDERLIEKP